jgi:hypothetical protein
MVSGAAGAVFGPAVAAVTLGLVGAAAFARRIGRNEAFNHAGNAAAALLAAGLAAAFGPIAVFWLMGGMAAASIAAVYLIPAGAIDHRAARGLGAGDGQEVSGWRTVIASRTLLVFAATAFLFHFANAAMLPLVGQKLARGVGSGAATSLVAATIVAAQAVMVPVALLVGRMADRWGTKPLVVAALLVLAVRGALYTLGDGATWLISVQLLDGVGAGIYGALFPIVIADATAGTGHFNVAQGAVGTLQGIGAALSTAVAGWIAAAAGYDAAFLTLAGAAAVALGIVALVFPGSAGDARSVGLAPGRATAQTE